MDIDNYQAGSGEDLSNYEIKSAREIERILSGMIKTQVLVTVQGHKTRQSYLTTLLGLNEQTGKLYFECSRDDLVDEDLSAGPGATLVAYHDGVRIQFVTQRADRALYSGLNAYKIDLPGSVYRIQRREFFRVATPQAQPARCIIPVGESQIETVVVDISVGGVGLRCALDEKVSQVADLLHGCRLLIPELGEYPVTLQVRNRMTVNLKNGAQVWRLGCEFANPSALLERDLQNYIFKLERERRSHEP